MNMFGQICRAIAGELALAVSDMLSFMAADQIKTSDPAHKAGSRGIDKPAFE